MGIIRNILACLLLQSVLTASLSGNCRERDEAAGGKISETEKSIILENRMMRFEISKDGYAASLVCKATGEECLVSGSAIPLCSVIQNRPYDNENFLMFPAKPISFPSCSVALSGDSLYVEFRDTYDIIVLKAEVRDSYIGFSPVKRDYRIEDYGVKRKTEIDGFAMLQLPVAERTRFGEWLNVIWDENAAVALIGTDTATEIDTFREGGVMRMYAGTDCGIKFFGAGAALVVSPPDSLLDCIAEVEKDYGLPRGVESRRSEEYRYSYYELRDFSLENIAEHISYAKAGGFKTIVLYYMDFASSCGHYLWKDTFPGGLEDLKQITSRIREAGLIPGFHFHYSKVSVTDPYVCSGSPDPRIGHVNQMMLAAPLGENDEVIHVWHLPSGLRLEDGRRLVHIGDELIEFTYAEDNMLKGCKRGMYGSAKASYPLGTRFAQADVDDWPYFIRIDQNSGIQQEIAERLGEIYREAGFRFVYFDGAEDVPEPYWYNVSRSQQVVYDALHPAPLFAEGALKSHYGWHILSRGNAFDHFPPERLRQAMKKYVLRCAERVADDFTSVNFGWLDYLAPSESTVGMQPDMYEYVCSKALAWDCPISLVGKLGELREHPRTADNLEVMRMWETAKLSDAFSAEQKKLLADPQREFLLLESPEGKYHIFEYEQITSDSERPYRAFSFEHDGKNCLVYWHTEGEGTLELDMAGYSFSLSDTKGREVTCPVSDGIVKLPAAGRMIIQTDMPAERLVSEFRKAAGYK